MGCLLCEWIWIFPVRLCRCRVLEETVTVGMIPCMLLCWGVVFAGLVILASSAYCSELLVPGGGWSASGVLLCVRMRRPRAFGFCMGERTSV